VPRINLRGVRKSYGGGAANAVEGLDLEIADGEFMCLLGPSGCGKTTTLRMIAGLEHLSDGEIRVGPRVVDSVGEGVFVPPENRQMGLVFQSYALWPHLTIERNTDFGLRLRNVPRAEREARVEKVMRTLGIEAYRHRYPSQLSGGQQQRVALARMLAVNPEVLLLDEPLSNLDAALRLEMRAELKRLHQEFGTTIVFVTHDQWEAMTLATTIAVMSQGRLQQVGSPNDIYDRPANRFVAQFVGNPPINMIDLAAGTPLAAAARGFLAGRAPAAGAVGIRPEAILLGEQAPADGFAGPAEVAGVLPTGGSWIVELAAEGGKLFLTTHQPPEVRPGERVRFAVRPQGLHVFDRDGNRAADALIAQARMH
jgi:iron(III) transport system ATP-binding protein